MTATAHTPTTPINENGDSVLSALHKEFVATFRGKTTAKRQKELVEAFKTAKSKQDTAEKAAEKAAAEASEAAKAIIREVCGKNRVTIGGETYSPMSRGARVFFRKEKAGTMDLG
jgi:predicted ribosome quality control (RQC) complex YloA/Tae2 family protein